MTRWITERPKTAGWYWFRWNKSSIPQVVEAATFQGHSDLWVRQLGFWVRSIKDGEFQGPLEPEA